MTCNSPLGILGGTFDPVHHGHLRLAVECLETLGLEEVRLIPSATPPHREAPQASPAHRLRMLELAVAGTAGLKADDREIRRGDVSYTISTLESLRSEFGDRSVCLILGMDAFRSLHTWHRWTSLPECAHIIVVDRPGSDQPLQNPDVREMVAARVTTDTADIARSPAGRLLKASLTLLDISSTQIRDTIAAGRDPRYLTPDGVIGYIREHELYRGAA